MQSFFFLCGHKGPPSGENAVGLSFKEKIYIHICKKLKVVKTQALDFETEGVCSIDGDYLVSLVQFASVISIANLVLGSLILNS